MEVIVRAAKNNNSEKEIIEASFTQKKKLI